jgi:phthalate 4,5-dioxygenase
MLSHDDVEFFCRVGKGTPTGEVYRRYWTPAMPAADLPRPNCPPVEFRVLGEDLVAFRDSDGKVGVLDRYCSHRGASLGIAAVEDCGLRCIYHGWLFATDGKIVETPNMPATSKFKDINKQGSYPAREAGGFIWVYMGPPEDEPPFPHYYWFDIPDDQIIVRESRMPVNYLQIQEGSIDSSHVGVLHHDMHAKAPEPDPQVANTPGIVRYSGWYNEVSLDGGPLDNVPSVDFAPVFDVENTDFGFQYAATRKSIYGDDRRYVRVTAFIFPYIGYIPPSASPVITVPIDDYTTASFSAWSKQRYANGGRMFGELPLPDQRMRVIPPQDRQAMEEGRSFTGWVGVGLQDAGVHRSMGPMYDRHNEHLVSPADSAVVRFRHVLRDEARRLAAGERVKFAFSSHPTELITAASGIIPENEHWNVLVPTNVSNVLVPTSVSAPGTAEVGQGSGEAVARS